MMLFVLALAAGTIDPAVTQATIHSTICVRGYARSVRPPVAYTSRLKRAQMRGYRLAGRMRDYQEDHLIPLELGGAPYDVANLWPEPIADARRKDREENRLHRLVCSGKASLQDAQQRMRHWK
jgi:hypothetical protein